MTLLKKLLAKGGPFLGLILVIALFSIPAETRGFFLSYHNFKIIFIQTVIVAIGALGMTFIIVSGGIDLAAGSGVAFASVVGALAIMHGYSTATVVALVILSGGLVGFIKGAAIAFLDLPPFIITLGFLGIARGGAKWVANNETINYDASPINTWMTTVKPFSYALPTGVWVTIALAIVTALILKKTVFGRHVFALGSNEATARLCGIPTTRLKILVYVVGGATSDSPACFSFPVCARAIRRSPSASNWTSSPR